MDWLWQDRGQNKTNTYINLSIIFSSFFQPQHHPGQPIHDPQRGAPVVKYYPPIPSPHDSQLDLAGEEVSRYFPTPSPRKSIPQPPVQQHPMPPPPPPSNPPQIDYQNVPNRRQSTGDYVQNKRAESVTPMVIFFVYFLITFVYFLLYTFLIHTFLYEAANSSNLWTKYEMQSFFYKLSYLLQPKSMKYWKYEYLLFNMYLKVGK